MVAASCGRAWRRQRDWETVDLVPDHMRVVQDLEFLNIYMSQQTHLLVDVTLRHVFIGAGRDGLTQERRCPHGQHPWSCIHTSV